MDTLRKLSKSAIIAVTALICTQSLASAMTLNGHVEERAQAEQSKPLSGEVSQGEFKTLKPSDTDLNPNTFPKSYQGDWSCRTIVVDSTLPTVTAGQVIESGISFYPTSDGRIQARWSQAGWVETQSTATSYGNDKAKSDRTAYFFGENSQGSWAARSREEFALLSPDTISASSYVDQYVDGQYSGRYRTQSVLKRTSENRTLANHQ
ncbi:MAG: hypothetical protein JST01_09185 [Cyanobacteria bacterium SZAS TMP-1]|nr:hypothetical protein [Cyanobacteria bacterium SZAS TMP-1]